MISCIKCTDVLTPDNWYNSNRIKNYRVCKKCSALQRKIWIEANSEKALKMVKAAQIKFQAKPEYPENTRQRSNKWRKDNPEKSMLRAAKFRAKKQNVPFYITVSDIIIPKLCPILGIPLIFGGKNNPNSPSLDRVIPSRGYIKENISVISNRANELKRDATLEEIVKLAHWFEEVSSNGQ